MSLYNLALYIHIIALVSAGGAGAISKLAAGRRARARTVGETLEWHNILVKTSKTFPISLALFVVTGSYMASETQNHLWAAAWVNAGLVGVVLLLVSGVYLGTRDRAIKKNLEAVASGGADQPAIRMTRSPFVKALPLVNSYVAFAVAFDMVAKPMNLSIALGIVVLGVVLGVALSMRPSKDAQAAGEQARAA